MNHGDEGEEMERELFVVLEWATMEKVLGACPDLNLEQLKALVDESGKMFRYIIT